MEGLVLGFGVAIKISSQFCVTPDVNASRRRPFTHSDYRQSLSGRRIEPKPGVFCSGRSREPPDLCAPNNDLRVAA